MRTTPNGSSGQRQSADAVDFRTGQMRVGGAAASPVAVETPFVTFSDGDAFVRQSRGVCSFCGTVVPADAHLPYAAEVHGDGTCRGIGLPTGPAPLDEGH